MDDHDEPASSSLASVVLSSSMRYRIIVALLAGGSVLSIVCFILSATQIGNGEHIGAGAFKVVGSCNSNKTLATHRPLHVSIVKANGAETNVHCGWHAKNNAIRMMVGLFCVAWPAFGLWNMLRRMHKPYMWIFVMLSFLATAFFFGAMCVDANDVRISSSWCSSGLSGIVGDDETDVAIDCSYGAFIGTTLFDAFLFVYWVGLVTLCTLYTRNQWDDEMHEPVDYFDSVDRLPDEGQEYDDDYYGGDDGRHTRGSLMGNDDAASSSSSSAAGHVVGWAMDHPDEARAAANFAYDNREAIAKAGRAAHGVVRDNPDTAKRVEGAIFGSE